MRPIWSDPSQSWKPLILNSEPWSTSSTSKSRNGPALSRNFAPIRRFLDLIIENIPHMIFVKDARELRYVKFNWAGEELMGH